jgi:glucosamine--fructose-6-phosphate aminotransferase (isomerizing)
LTVDVFRTTSLMLREVREAPEAVARLLAANERCCRDLAERLRASPLRFAVTCARGSSDSAATYVKYLLEIRLGLVVASVGPSISSIYGVRPRMSDVLFIAISQSGRSPDLVRLTETARESGALTLALVNDVDSPLAACCDVILPLHAGPELSVAATKSYLASLAAFLQLLAYWSGDAAIDDAVGRLPEALRDALDCDWQAALPALKDCQSLYIVGRGPGYAAAQEAALKLKEVCGLHAEALSAAELMHGPLALVDRTFPVLLFSQADESAGSLGEIEDMLSGRDVPVIAAGPGCWRGALTLPTIRGGHAFAQPIPLMQSFYTFAEALARVRGRDPDAPPHLRKVTQTL